jgi:hypothetical protein
VPASEFSREKTTGNEANVKRVFSAIAGDGKTSSDRTDAAAVREQTLRALVDRRCDLYVRVAGLVMDVEDALDRDDPDRARYAFDEMRRALRSSLAFLSDEVRRALEQAEACHVGESAASEEDLRDALQVLHVRLARLLDLPGQDIVEVMGLSERLRQKLAADEAATEEREKRRALDERLRTDEILARELIAQKQYKKALRVL